MSWQNNLLNLNMDFDNKSGSVGDISDYNPFVFEYISTPEYVLFTCSFDRTIEKKTPDSNILIPLDFSNIYIRSLMEVKIVKSDRSKEIYESDVIYNQLVNSQALGEIHFDGSYTDPGSCGSVECFKVTKATGMFAGISKVIKDFTQPTRTLYFVKAMDYF